MKFAGDHPEAKSARDKACGNGESVAKNNELRVNRLILASPRHAGSVRRLRAAGANRVAIRLDWPDVSLRPDSRKFRAQQNDQR